MCVRNRAQNRSPDFCKAISKATSLTVPAEFLSNRRPRHRGMAASSPLHRDASASHQPSSHSLHCFTASNAALPSHKIEGLVGPLRPLSGSRSCGARPRPLPLPFAHALRADTRTLTAARGRSLRVQPCHRILEATTMRRTAGIENKIRTRVERREKGSDRLPPYLCVRSHRCTGFKKRNTTEAALLARAASASALIPLSNTPARQQRM